MTQLTRFENSITIKRSGSKIIAETGDRSLTVQVGTTPLKGISLVTQKSANSASGLSSFELREGNDTRVEKKATGPILWLFGRDVLSNIMSGAVPHYSFNFGDWALGRFHSKPLILYEQSLKHDWLVNMTLIGRGQSTVAFGEDREIEVFLNDGYIDNNFGVCIRQRCTNGPATEGVMQNLLRTLNFLLEISLIGIVLRLLLPSPLQPGTQSCCPARGSLTFSVLALAAVHLCICLWFSTFILGGIPHIPDSANYLRQAIMLTEGMLFFPTNGLEEVDAYLSNGSVKIGEHVAYIYNHFWPAIIALGQLLNMPYVVNPTLSTVLLLIIYKVASRLFSPAVALMSALLYSLSPLAVLNAGDYMNHVCTATLLWGGFLFLLKWSDSPSSKYALLVGILFSYAFAIRPLTSAALIVPFSLYFAINGFRIAHWKKLLPLPVGALVILLLMVCENKLMTGNYLTSPYQKFHGLSVSLKNLPFGLNWMDSNLGYLPAVLFSFPLSHLWIGASALFTGATRPVLLLWTTVVSLYGAYCCFNSVGLHGYGPRFLFEGTAALYILTANGLVTIYQSLTPRLKRTYQATLVICTLVAASKLFFYLPEYRNYNGISSEVYQEIKSKGRAVIVVPGGSWQDMDHSAALFDPHFKDLVVIKKLPDNQQAQVLEKYSDRPHYELINGKLVPLPNDHLSPPQ